ncbi:MAG: DUF3791 domain-containing protein [Bacteroidetes bacterium]|nr:DUF3791 domain-containing protein [Bacteroidota bacterium]MBU1720549.1 DUF3791 domain-containing protein [Bacteroidota bacterium]
MITLNSIQQFQIFCLENYKTKNKICGEKALQDFSDFGVFSFLESGYDVLHTQGESYLTAEIVDFIKAKNEHISR